MSREEEWSCYTAIVVCLVTASVFLSLWQKSSWAGGCMFFGGMYLFALVDLVSERMKAEGGK